MVASGIMSFAACSQSDDLVQDNTLDVAQEEMPVAFSTYVASNTNATTRSTYGGTGLFATTDLEGTYNATPSSRTGGFGIYAYTHTGATVTVSEKPDFMLNQQVVKNGASGWVYDPVKYWPNQTASEGTANNPTDSQTGNTATAPDRKYVSFFAYAPYIPLVAEEGINGIRKSGTYAGNVFGATAQVEYGITQLPVETTPNYPKVHYVMNPTAAQSQDLLFGVAPAGGISYRAVNGEQVTVAQGMGLEKMLKPATHTQMKFLFLHALTALKINIAAAIDELSPGTNALDAATKVYVNSITLTPVAAVDPATAWSIASAGDLNLNPTTAGIPNWESPTTATNLKIGTTVGTDAVNVQINTDLQNGGAGVTNKKRDVFTDHSTAAGTDDTTFDPLMFIPIYTGIFNRTLTVTIDYDVVTTDAAVSGGKVTVNNIVSKDVILKAFKAGRIYDLSIVLGLTSIKVDAEGFDWAEEDTVIDLPRNLD